jgi:hypothetical protein
MGGQYLFRPDQEIYDVLYDIPKRSQLSILGVRNCWYLL